MPAHTCALASRRGTENAPALIAALQTVSHMFHSWAACQQFLTMEHWRAGELGSLSAVPHDGTLAGRRGTENAPALIVALQTVIDMLHSWTACQQILMMEHWRAGELYSLSAVPHDGTLAGRRGTENAPALIVALQTVIDMLHSWTACQQFLTMEHWRAGEVLRMLQLSLLPSRPCHTCYTVVQPVSSSSRWNTGGPVRY
ncbi:hypothetical protein J6590_054785 [Homalodisca vitripennis]|nr:hypothetical protein J6590_054785 [Homalodisca vitripennis]